MLIVRNARLRHSFALESHDHGEGTGVQRGDGIHDTVQGGFPAKVCSTFGLEDFMRVPSPAARIIAADNAEDAIKVRSLR